MGTGISNHIRSNIVGYVALFVALSASAYALPGTNTVDSGDIKNGQVMTADVGNGQIGTADVANNSLTGADVLESKLGRVPAAGNADKLDHFNSTDFLGRNAQAGGDLSGQLSNLQIAGNAVGSGEVADNSLTGGDIDESSLSGVVSGTGQVLTGSVAVTSGNSQTILALPGWGDVRVGFCGPSATPANRFASPQFHSTGPSGTAWTIGGQAGHSVHQSFTSNVWPILGDSSAGDNNANEGLSVFLTRTDSFQAVSLWIGEITGNTTCEFDVQAVMSGLPGV